MTEPEAGGRCADLSEAAGESLAATAVTARALAPRRGAGRLASRRLGFRSASARGPGGDRRLARRDAALAAAVPAAARTGPSDAAGVRRPLRGRNQGRATLRARRPRRAVGGRSRGRRRARRHVAGARVCSRKPRPVLLAARDGRVRRSRRAARRGGALDLVAPRRAPVRGERRRAPRRDAVRPRDARGGAVRRRAGARRQDRARALPGADVRTRRRHRPASAWCARPPVSRVSTTSHWWRKRMAGRGSGRGTAASGRPRQARPRALPCRRAAATIRRRSARSQPVSSGRPDSARASGAGGTHGR